MAWWILSLVLSPLQAPAKLRKILKRRRWSDTAYARWRVDDLTPELRAKSEGRPGPRVLFAAVSFGEAMLADRVATELRAIRPDVETIYCLADINTINFFLKERPEQALAVWPFDALPPVARLLKQQRPDVVVFTERFRFVAFVTGAGAYGARVALINGRSRQRTGLLYRIVAPLYRWQFRPFSTMAMQTAKFADAAKALAREDCEVCVTGDIKTDVRIPKVDAENAASLAAWLSSDLPLIAAGSTENLEEEEMVLDAFLRTRETVPCRLLLAPRRPWQLDGLIELLNRRGISFSRRSLGQPVADVMLLDTLGELFLAYGSCQVAYVGGSYSPDGGGHNMMEPLLQGLPVSYGMTRGHFGPLQLLCESRGVSTRIKGADDLAQFFVKFLRDEAARVEIGSRGQKMVEEGQGAVDRTVECLLPLLPTPTID